MSEIAGFEEHLAELHEKKELDKTAYRPRPKEDNLTKEDIQSSINDITKEHSAPVEIDDGDDPLSDKNIEAAGRLVRKVSQSVQIVQGIWESTKRMYGLTAEQMYRLHQYNMVHRKNQEPDTPDEKYDEFNGLDNITPLEIGDIFGPKHPHTMAASVNADGIIGIIKENLIDYVDYVRITNEYNQTDRAYRTLLDMREDKDMLELKKVAEETTDETKKQELLDVLERHDKIRFLGYLRDPLDSELKTILINAFGDEKKVGYWINRSRDKLTQMNLTQRFILEIANFEKVQLPERYHRLSNMLLLYFMHSVVYTDVAGNITDNAKKYERDKIYAMINALDSVVRKSTTDENIEKIKNNVIGLLEQVIEPIYAKYYPDKIIPDIATNNGTDNSHHNDTEVKQQ